MSENEWIESEDGTVLRVVNGTTDFPSATYLNRLEALAALAREMRTMLETDMWRWQDAVVWRKRYDAIARPARAEEV